MPRTIRYAIVGLGNIGRNVLEVYANRRQQIADQYDLAFRLVGAADSSGAAVRPEGLDIAQIREIKYAGKGVSEYPESGRHGMAALEMVQEAEAEVLVDASPTNLKDGEPGMSCVRAALRKEWHVVTSNKGPLVLAFGELMDLAQEMGVKLLYCGTVAGGLPVINMGTRDLAGCGITRVEGIFNGTTNYILTRMLEEEVSYEEALKGAQDAGIAEPDPTLDVDGWDAANKLVIVANGVLGRPTTLDDVEVEGIRDVTLEDLREARERGQVIKPLASAIKRGKDYVLQAGPMAIDEDHPLAHTGQWDMGVVYYTDFMGIITALIEEKGPVPTSAAMLRDMINIYART
ncbi:MAG: homoserine dehydrogenase [Chloroflexota bacterium]|nr:homoserine dehydrogenase [Chloroflexota bacterium]